jgi:hypothetical protein
MLKAAATSLIRVRSPSKMAAPNRKEWNCLAACRTRGSVPSGEHNPFGMALQFLNYAADESHGR